MKPELLLPSYMTLCKNPRLPLPEEAKTLSMEIVLKIAAAREQILLNASESGCKTPTTASVPDEVAKGIIANLFDMSILPNNQSQANGNASGDRSVNTEVITVNPPKKGKNAELPANGQSSVSQNKCFV